MRKSKKERSLKARKTRNQRRYQSTPSVENQPKETIEQLSIPLDSSELDEIAHSLASGEDPNNPQMMAKVFSLAVKELAHQMKANLSHLSPQNMANETSNPLMQSMQEWVPESLQAVLAQLPELLADKIEQVTDQLESNIAQQLEGNPAGTPPPPSASLPAQIKHSLTKERLQEIYARAQNMDQEIAPKRIVVNPALASAPTPKPFSISFGSEAQNSKKSAEKSDELEETQELSVATPEVQNAMPAAAPMVDNAEPAAAPMVESAEPTGVPMVDDAEPPRELEVALPREDSIAHDDPMTGVSAASPEDTVDHDIPKSPSPELMALQDNLEQFAQIIHDVILELHSQLPIEALQQEHEENLARLAAEEEEAAELASFLNELNEGIQDVDMEDGAIDDNEDLSNAFSQLLENYKDRQ